MTSFKVVNASVPSVRLFISSSLVLKRVVPCKYIITLQVPVLCGLGYTLLVWTSYVSGIIMYSSLCAFTGVAIIADHGARDRCVITSEGEGLQVAAVHHLYHGREVDRGLTGAAALGPTHKAPGALVCVVPWV
jgi:hypothetical protein